MSSQICQIPLPRATVQCGSKHTHVHICSHAYAAHTWVGSGGRVSGWWQSSSLRGKWPEGGPRGRGPRWASALSVMFQIVAGRHTHVLYISLKRNKENKTPKISETGITEVILSLPQNSQIGQNPTFLEGAGEYLRSYSFWLFSVLVGYLVSEIIHVHQRTRIVRLSDQEGSNKEHRSSQCALTARTAVRWWTIASWILSVCTCSPPLI